MDRDCPTRINIGEKMNSDHNRRRHDTPRGKDASKEKQENRKVPQGENEKKKDDKKGKSKKRSS